MHNMKKRLYFKSFYFLSYFAFGIVMSNLTPFLATLGYNAMQRGILLSAYAITTIIFQLLFGVFVDKYQTIKRIVLWSTASFATASIVLFDQSGQNLPYHIALVALTGGLLNTLCGLYDTWILSSGDEIRSHLSFIKAFGSIGWSLGSFVASYLIMLLTYSGMISALFVITILLFVNLHYLNDIQQIHNKNTTKIKDVCSLLKNRKYMLLILILFLMYAVVVANNCTVIDKMIKLGADQTQISLKWSLQSLLEIPTYLFGVRVLKRFQYYQLLQISASMLTIQFVLFAITQNVTIMIFLSIFQLFSTPLILITSKSMIFDLCPPLLRGSSQLVALSIFTGASSLLIPALAGTFSVYMGYDQTLIIASCFSAAAFLLIFRLKRIG